MGKKKILLADDADLIFKLEKALFRRRSFHLLVARNGSQVLETVEGETPSLIFLDLFMADMAGDECCRLIKANPRLRAVPVVLLARHAEEDLDRCRMSGCEDVLLRPIDRHVLADMVRRLLAIPSRSACRYEASLRVTFGPHSAELLSGETLNLSTAGILLETRHLFPVDTRLSLEIHLPAMTRSLRCTGRVAWLSRPERRMGGEMAVQFLDLPADDKDLLQIYLETDGRRPDR